VARSYSHSRSIIWLALCSGIVFACIPIKINATEIEVGTYTGSNQAWADWTDESVSWWNNTTADDMYVCSARFRIGYTSTDPAYSLMVRYGTGSTTSTSDWIEWDETLITVLDTPETMTLFSLERSSGCFLVEPGKMYKVWFWRDSHMGEYSMNYWKLGSVTAHIDPPHGAQQITADSEWYLGAGFLETFLDDEEYYIGYTTSSYVFDPYSSSTYAFTDPDFGWFGNAMWDVLKSLFVAPIAEIGQWIFDNIGKIKYRSPWGYFFRAVDVITDRNATATASTTGMIIPFHYDQQNYEMINISDTAVMDFDWSPIRTASAFFITIWFIFWVWSFGIRVIDTLADLL